MNEEYATTLGELRDLIEVVIIAHGKDTPYVLIGCYGAEGLAEKAFAREADGEQRVRLFTDLCSG